MKYLDLSLLLIYNNFIYDLLYGCLKWVTVSQERSALHMAVSNGSRSVKKQQLQTQNQIITSVGCLFVIATMVFSVIGAKLAINSINRDAQDAIVYAQQQVAKGLATSVDDIVISKDDSLLTEKSDVTSTEDIIVDKLPTDIAESNNVIPNDNSDKIINSTDDWSDEQVRWMFENKIRYNEHGQPVDLYGNIVVDPTVQSNVNMSVSDDIVLQNNTLDSNISTDNSNSDIISNEKLETNTDWFSGKDYLIQKNNGDYIYEVQIGDSLMSICMKMGFSLDEIIEYNQISNPDVLTVGDFICFPQDGPKGTSGNTNLGLG